MPCDTYLIYLFVTKLQIYCFVEMNYCAFNHSQVVVRNVQIMAKRLNNVTRPVC